MYTGRGLRFLFFSFLLVGTCADDIAPDGIIYGKLEKKVGNGRYVARKRKQI